MAGQAARRAPTATLTRPALGRLLDHAAEVMQAALGQGGTSFDALYVNVNGESGYFDRSLARLRAGGPAVPPLRDADPARVVHEPLVVTPARAASRDRAAPRGPEPASRTRGAHSPG